MKALQFDASPLAFAKGKFFGFFLGKKSYIQGPGRTIGLVDIPEPSLPSPDWVKIKTRYCGFCGSDLNLIMLHDSPSAQPFTSFPCIPGHEFVGEIVEAGPSVSGFAHGDRVAVNPVIGCEARGLSPVCGPCASGRTSHCERQTEGRFPPGMFIGLTKDLNGAFAPYTVAHKSQLYRIPDGLSWEAAVMTEPTAVALQAVLENRPSDSDRILVIGGGVIGNLIVQTVKALGIGCRIAVVEPSGFAGDLARTCGADDIIRPDEVYKKTSVITGARIFKPIIGRPLARGGFDKIYDTVGNSSTVNTGLRLLATGGTLSLVGIGSNLTIDPTTLWLKLQTVKGVFGYGRVDHQGRSCHAFDLALTLMNEGRIRGETLITHTFRLDDYREMVGVNMEKHRHGAMKTIVSFEDA